VPLVWGSGAEGVIGGVTLDDGDPSSEAHANRSDAKIRMLFVSIPTR
jgi:hypothetical protein